MSGAYDRSAEDVGNVVHLEHVNVTQPDQHLATLFYVVALGGTRDPYMMVGVANMWVNFGRTQMHLPTGAPQRLRGTIGFVVPDLDELRTRLARVERDLAATQFSWQDGGGKERGEFVEAICPWGNRLRCHAPAAEFGPIDLGLAYVEFDVPRDTAAGIARFYTQIIGCPSQVVNRNGAASAAVPVGRNQLLHFTETDAPAAGYDGHHIQVYMADFSGPYAKLLERGRVTMETDAHEWRFRQIFDPQSGAPLFELEHEVRSLKHPLYGRALVNRNPSQTNTGYKPGQDAFRGVY